MSFLEQTYYALLKDYGTTIKLVILGKAEVDIETGVRVTTNDRYLPIQVVETGERAMNRYEKQFTKNQSKVKFLALTQDVDVEIQYDYLEYNGLKYHQLALFTMKGVVQIEAEGAK